MFANASDFSFDLTRENKTRKRILTNCLRDRQSFDSLEDYNNHLEEIEDLIYNISNKIDTERMHEKMEELKRLNAGRHVQEHVEEVDKKRKLETTKVEKKRKFAPNVNVERRRLEQEANNFNALHIFSNLPQMIHEMKNEVDPSEQNEEYWIKRNAAGGWKYEDALARAYAEAESVFL